MLYLGVIRRVSAIVFLMVSLFCTSQNIDSLLKVFNASGHDTIKFKAALSIFDHYLKKNPFEKINRRELEKMN